MRKRIASSLAALALCLSLLPGTALAAGETENSVAKITKADSTVMYVEELNSDTFNNNPGATITLLKNVEVSSSIYVPATATLDLNGCTLSGATNVLYVHRGGNLTIQDSNTSGGGCVQCTSLTLYAVRVMPDSAVHITGGEFKGGMAGFMVESGARQCTVSGGKFSRIGYSPNVKDVLVKGCAYYDAAGKIITQGLDENRISNVTVKPCTHSYAQGVCVVCGAKTDIEAQVMTGGSTQSYADFNAAWTAANTATSPATVRLLSDVNLGSGKLTVQNNSDITLEMANGVTLSADGIVIQVAGTFTLTSGTVKGGGIQGSIVVADPVKVVITGGSVIGEGDSSVGLVAHHLGRTQISGGIFQGGKASISMYGNQGVVSSLLARDYAFWQNEAWVADPDVPALAGSVTVKRCDHQGVSEYRQDTDADTHTFLCTACGKQETSQCDYRYTETDIQHIKTCKFCGRRVAGNHQWEYYAQTQGSEKFVELLGAGCKSEGCSYGYSGSGPDGRLRVEITPDFSVPYGKTEGKMLAVTPSFGPPVAIEQWQKDGVALEVENPSQGYSLPADLPEGVHHYTCVLPGEAMTFPPEGPGDSEPTFSPIQLNVTVTVTPASGGSDNSGSGGGGGGTTAPTPPPVNTDTDNSGGAPTTETTAKPAATTRGDTATATINKATADEIVKQATEHQSETVVIAPEVKGDVTKTEVSIPAQALGEIGSKTEASVTVSTPVAELTIPNGGLGSLASGGGTVTVTAQKQGDSVTLSITAGGETVAEIPGGITLTVPHDDCNPAPWRCWSMRTAAGKWCASP